MSDSPTKNQVYPEIEERNADFPILDSPEQSSPGTFLIRVFLNNLNALIFSES